jgi:hypothetical protein
MTRDIVVMTRDIVGTLPRHRRHHCRVLVPYLGKCFT